MSDYLPSFIVEPVLRQARRFSERRGGDEPPRSPTLSRSVSGPVTVATSDLDPVYHYSRFTLPNLPTLPAVPSVDLQRFNPSRFWNQSPPPSTAGERGMHGALVSNTAVLMEEEDIDDGNGDQMLPQESTLQSIARNIQLWANQINNLDIIPSPPLHPAPMPPVHVMGEGLSANATATGGEAETTEFPPLQTEVVQQPPPLAAEAHGRQQTGRTNSETSLNPAHELSYQSMEVERRDNGRSSSDPSTASNAARAIPEIGSHDYRGDETYRRRDGSGALPEDDGMGPLRKRITAIWASTETPQEKSKMVHTLMMERYARSQSRIAKPNKGVNLNIRPSSPSNQSITSQDTSFNLNPADLVRTYAPVDSDTPDNAQDSASMHPGLGCIHYKRNVKMQCATCERWYTCRLCHDEAEDHQLPRRATKNMLCMICSTPQRVGQDCRMCGTQAACYYCPICKLWNNDAEKSIYHCDDCGICRLGEGLGKDFFHCKTCAACMSIRAESTHKCIEKSTKCDCPICGEYMFTSNRPVAFMRCGHSIHESCFLEWCNTSYKCPICSKSIANMESQFRRLDRHIEEQPMPEEYRNNRAYVFCNDCNSRSVTRYHWLGLKCAVCDSYNTAQLEMLDAESSRVHEENARAQAMGVGEAGFTASQSHTPTEELTEPAPTASSRELTPSPAVSRPTTSDSDAVDVSSATAARLRSPPSRRDSPFHATPHSPGSLAPRGASPSVGNYFNTGHNRVNSENRRASYFSVFSSGSVDPNEDMSNVGTRAQPYQQQPRPSSSHPSAQFSQSSSGLGPSFNIGLLPSSAAHSIPTASLPRQGTTPLLIDDDEEEELDFWGGQSPRSCETDLIDAPVEDDSDDDQSSSSDDDDFDIMDHDNDDDDNDDDEADLMEIIGHR